MRPRDLEPEQGAVQLDGTAISYRVKRSRRRRKTVEIRIDRGGLEVAAPSTLSIDEIERVLRDRERWILRKLANPVPESPRRRFVTGEAMPYLGRDLPINVDTSDGGPSEVGLDHGSFRVTVAATLSGGPRRDRIIEAFQRWYRARAEERVPVRVDHWSAHTGWQPSGVLIRNQRRRWGSCAADGTLRFNWRLVLVEPALLDYVVVHELAHLDVPNHSGEFWAAVSTAMPDYRERRRELRDVGAPPTF